jgi:hypothetical protein
VFTAVPLHQFAIAPAAPARRALVRSALAAPATAWPAFSAGTTPPLDVSRLLAFYGSTAVHAGHAAAQRRHRSAKRSSSFRTQRTLSPNSDAACFWLMCRFSTSCKTFSRSRSFADIHPDFAFHGGTAPVVAKSKLSSVTCPV